MKKDIQSLLEETSPSFCLAKWLQVSLLLQNGLGHSCHHPAPQKIPLAELEAGPAALHNHAQKKETRRLMLLGERPKECQYCWNVEDSGGRSDRLYKSEEYWAAPYIDEVRKASHEHDIIPKYLEVSFSHNCNFKCAYCGPQSSSRWVEEAEKFGPYPTSMNFGDLEWFKSSGHLPFPHEEENPYVKAFWQWWPTIKPKLEVFRITGGEPLMSPATWRVLDDLIANPQSNLRFAINSNMGVSSSKVDRLVEKINSLEGKVKNFTLFTSIDSGLPKHAEYLRYGMDFDLFKRNIETVLENINWRIRLTMICTVNALSIPGLEALFRWNYELRERFPEKSIGIDTPYLRYPNFLSVATLDRERIHEIQSTLDFIDSRIWEPSKQDTKVADWTQTKFLGFENREFKRLERVKDWALEENERIKLDQDAFTTTLKDRSQFLHEYDRRRGLDHRSLFNSLL